MAARHRAPLLSDDTSRYLCLRHDPERNGELAAAIERLKRAYERVVGPEHSIAVLLVDGAIPERERWERGLGVEVLRAPSAGALNAFATGAPSPLQVAFARLHPARRRSPRLDWSAFSAEEDP